jgi:hypothetical protein
MYYMYNKKIIHSTINYESIILSNYLHSNANSLEANEEENEYDEMTTKMFEL